MTVRAKLFVSSVTRQASTPDAVKVTFGAVTQGEENRTWAEATPMASFEMTIQNPEAAARFVLGQEFYVDFTLAEPVSSLADGHAYEATEAEQSHPAQAYHRCAVCRCKRASHDEPLRSQLVRVAGLA